MVINCRSVGLRCREFKTLRIDMQKLISSLIEELLQSKMVEFIRRDFQSLEEIEGLRLEKVFNCLGYGARKIFKD